jgi:hypothetical protein
VPARTGCAACPRAHGQPRGASGGAAHRAGPPLTRQGRFASLRERFAPLDRRGSATPPGRSAGRPGPARWARGATGGGLADMIKGSARKRANPTRKRAEAPSMAAGRMMIGDPLHSLWFGPQSVHGIGDLAPAKAHGRATQGRDQRLGAKPCESDRRTRRSADQARKPASWRRRAPPPGRPRPARAACPAQCAAARRPYASNSGGHVPVLRPRTPCRPTPPVDEQRELRRGAWAEQGCVGPGASGPRSAAGASPRRLAAPPSRRRCGRPPRRAVRRS